VTYNIELINAEFLSSVNAGNFEETALAVFRYQYENNPLYHQFVDALKTDVNRITRTESIPFLPVSFFKTHTVISGKNGTPELIFESSGTTGETPSRHYVSDAGIYEYALLSGFKQFYGEPSEYAIIAMLPSYLERKNASLVHMAQTLMAYSGHPDGGFYLDEWAHLAALIARLEQNGQKVLLLGVTFALLDFAAAYPMSLRHTIVMETGGMKGRREEWTRKQVHDYLKQQWQLENVHSEYGMTELLSQAYAMKDGVFSPAHTMQVLIRDINDPLDVKRKGLGALNIIDLANLHSCSFIATEDIGNIAADGTFEVLGRMDHAVLRGCNLMVI